jgi:two-component sensor histidine kinase
VDLGSYLQRLVGLLQVNAAPNVQFSVSADTMATGSRRASAIGMIVSEFAANSLKHAFPGNRGGGVRITLRRAGESEAELTCEDDGVGTQPANAGEVRRGLGLRIIAASVGQIGGQIDAESPASGARFRATFPLRG